MAVAINGFVYFTMVYGHWKPGKWWILSSVVLWMIRRDDMRAGVQLAGYPYDSKEMPPMVSSHQVVKINDLICKFAKTLQPIDHISHIMKPEFNSLHNPRCYEGPKIGNTRRLCRDLCAELRKYWYTIQWNFLLLLHFSNWVFQAHTTYLILGSE